MLRLVLLALAAMLLPAGVADEGMVRLLRQPVQNGRAERAVLLLADDRHRADVAHAAGAAQVHVHDQGVRADHAREALRRHEDAREGLLPHRPPAGPAPRLLPVSVPAELSLFAGGAETDRDAARRAAPQRRRVPAPQLVDA